MARDTGSYLVVHALVVQNLKEAAMMDMFSLLGYVQLPDGNKDKQVKKRRTSVLAVGMAEDDDGANAEDERGEAEETCSEQAQQAAVKKKKEKKKKKGKRQNKEKNEDDAQISVGTPDRQFNRQFHRQFNRQFNKNISNQWMNYFNKPIILTSISLSSVLIV